MTLLEKALELHNSGEITITMLDGIPNICPWAYGFWGNKKPDFSCLATDIKCEDCWNREYIEIIQEE